MNEKEILEGNINKTIIKIASPVAVNNLFFGLYGLVDILFVSQIGALELATIVFIQPIESLFVAIGDGLAIGSTSMIGKEIGAGRSGKHIMHQLLILAFLIGSISALLVFLFTRPILLLFSIDPSLLEMATTYFRILSFNILLLFMNRAYYGIKRAQGETMGITVVNTTSIIVKLVFLVVTIFVFDLKFAGVLLSTFMGNAVITGFALYDLFINKRIVSKKDPILIRWDEIKQILTIGFPIMIEKSTMSFGQIIVNKYALAYGVGVLTAFGITNRINSVIFSFLTGFGTGVSILVAQNLGAKNYERVKKFVNQSFIISCTLAFSTISILIIFRTPVAALFTNQDSEVLRHTVNAITVYSVSAIPWAAMQIVIGYFQGTGQTKFNLMISFSRLYVFRIPIIFILTQISSLGEYSVWLGMLISNTLVAIFGYFFLRKKQMELLNQEYKL
ncbi:MATE family efflux transporter [Jeotgalibaca sp. MA1X17-3]|uniref:MATE family efflux transporter n=1 Tax=Jeotgalibaca sp. MA1X17-3 TaxID=2908211 RepID=UPI001F35937C|nr:MATE family efflux transporter [Jeotgalibaca sp. MA1X17-3]UJF15709.1 MATE family efflux transporter [Jeotgalibaca sp. MA1X17-3]